MHIFATPAGDFQNLSFLRMCFVNSLIDWLIDWLVDKRLFLYTLLLVS